jgi:hypothetical protein
VVSVTPVYVILAEGVQYAVPAVTDVLVANGDVPFVTFTPPGVYPAPVTSPVVLYAVVLALYVADAKYKAALNVLPVPVVKLWMPSISSSINDVHIACVFAMMASSVKRCRLGGQGYSFFQLNVRRTVHKLAIQPILDPSRVLALIINNAFSFFKKRLVHFAFGCGHERHYEILMIADVFVTAGNCTVNVVELDLSLPKSKTQTVGFVVPLSL